jgi:peptidoglycan/LPS O-acetylase OafA/YrhL
MNEKKGLKIPFMSAVIFTIIAIFVICIISVFFGIIPINSLPTSYIGATLGSLIGALITLVLLRGQTDIEEKKGKDIKILERKTEIFHDYIKDVWKV